MKKNIKLKILYLAMATLVMACSDMLDKDPLTQLPAETFWKTEQDVQAALAASYSGHRTSIFGSVRGANGVSMDSESLSDNAISSSSFGNYSVILQGGISPATTGAVSQFWSDCYDGIAKCNYFLDHIDEAKSFLTDASYSKYKAEALFNRSYYYNELVQRYGDVPLVLYTQTIDSVVQIKNRPRSPKADVVAKMLTDIDVAIAGLSADRYTDGHAVKGSAIMLKVRILMNNQRFAEAASVAWSLIGDAKNPYSLYKNYSGLFFKEQRATENKEIMFSVIYQAPTDYHQLDQYVGSRMSCFPTPQLRDAYEVKDVLSGAKDPRLKMTIFQTGDDWVNNTKTGKFEQTGSVAESTIPFTKMAFKKWIDPTIVTPNASTLSDQNIVKMRYADLLLLYAEAMFESGQGTDVRALKALNDVRARPGVEMPAKLALTRDIIRNERRVELAYEGIRYNDIIRWGIAETVIPQIVFAANGSKRKFDGYLWPIPQGQMDIMQGVWQNNAPWN